MSDLDDFLGPREPRNPLPPRRTPGEILAAGLQATGRWRCEDRIKGTLDAFIEAMGEDWMPRSDVGRRSMYASARPIVDEIGEVQAPGFVRWAVGVMRRKVLDVKDLRSLAFLIPTWRKDQGGPQWMRIACPECHSFHPEDEMCGYDPDDDAGRVECPRCHLRVNPASLDMRCEGAHYVRGHGPPPEGGEA